MIAELEPIANQMKELRMQLLHLIEHAPTEWLDRALPGQDWSIKDILAHLTANQTLMTEVAKGIASGGSPQVPDDFDNDRFNAESVAARHDKSIHELLDALSGSQHGLLAFLEGVQPNQLARRGKHPLEGDLNLREFLSVMYAHEASHTRAIAEHLQELRAASALSKP